MQRTKIALIVAVIIIVLPLIGVFTGKLHIYTDKQLKDITGEAYSEGYDVGIEEGHEEGYEEGYEEGSNENNVVTSATVYYTDDGECYHMNPSCLALRDSTNIHETTLDELSANNSFLRPCDICVAHSDD